VTCQVPDVAGVRVTLFYRVAGQESYTPVPMKERLGEWVGRIPAREMSGKSIQYYIESKDSKGKTIGNSGSAANPNIILISVAARPHYYSEMGDEGKGEDFVVKPRKKEKPKTEETGTPGGRTLRLGLGIPALIVGAALAGTAGGLYYQASQQKATLEKKAKEGAPFTKKLQQIQNAGKLNMTLGTVSLVGAVVFLAAGTTVFLLVKGGKEGPTEKEAPDAWRRASITPVFGPNAVGLTSTVTF